MSASSQQSRPPQIGVTVYSPGYGIGGNLPTRIYLDDGKRTCPTCNGKGINPVLPYRVCPKCDGEKRIPYPRRGR